MSQRINAYFDTSRELRQLSHKVAQLLVLQRHYEQIVPISLTRASRVMRVEHKSLTISADNSAIAAKLRQLAPQLIRLFQEGGHEVTGIQVRVQVALSPQTYRSSPTTISLAGRQRLVDLAEKLPDSPLKKAVQRLAKGKK